MSNNAAKRAPPKSLPPLVMLTHFGHLSGFPTPPAQEAMFFGETAGLVYNLA